MSSIISIILNYIWVFIKLLLFSAAVSLPFVALTYLLKDKFNWLRTKKNLSFALSLFIIIFVVSYIVLLFTFFLPALGKFSTFSFLEAIAFIFLHIARLLLVNLLFTAMLFIIAMFISLLYDSFVNKKVKKRTKTKIKVKTSITLSFFSLWKSFSMVFFIMFLFLIIVFPGLIAIILYLIFL